jgi:hypothetical protein
LKIWKEGNLAIGRLYRGLATRNKVVKCYMFFDFMEKENRHGRRQEVITR